jgi:hypothetical protein
MGAAAAIGRVTVWDTACLRRRRDVKQANAKMFAKEKETLKRRMAEIKEVGTSNKEYTPPSLTPV